MSTSPAGNERAVLVAPEYFVRDIARSVAFYADKLGFQILRREPDFAVVALGDAHVLLAAPNEGLINMMRWLDSGPRGVGVHVRIMVDDVDATYRRMSASSVRVVNEIGDRGYGMRDFVVADPDGFLLRFASPIEG